MLQHYYPTSATPSSLSTPGTGDISYVPSGVDSSLAVDNKENSERVGRFTWPPQAGLPHFMEALPLPGSSCCTVPPSSRPVHPPITCALDAPPLALPVRAFAFAIDPVLPNEPPLLQPAPRPGVPSIIDLDAHPTQVIPEDTRLNHEVSSSSLQAAQANHAVAGPSTLRQLKRVQPVRAVKTTGNKTKDVARPDDTGTLSVGRKRRAIQLPNASPESEGLQEPPPKRRRRAELEHLVAPESQTRCGLGGCQVKARAHARDHYSKLETSKAQDSDPSKLYTCIYRDPSGKKCEYAVGSMQNLSRHVEHKHYGWQFKCTNCAKGFSRRENLHKHEASCGAA
ncbi:hypothetical protein FKP32DRAFT_1743405 [Trametes sanguinea]|nr:hypothetical protein FKP32DRAFT_1743405 [Trametes sanguinea]